MKSTYVLGQAIILSAVGACSAAVVPASVPDASEGGTDGAPIEADDSAVGVRVTSARLLAPMSTGVTSTAMPTLRWLPDASATSYRMEVCNDRACSSLVASGTVAAGNTAWRVPMVLARGHYYWHVGAVDSAGAVGWTVLWEFFVVATEARSADTSWVNRIDADADGQADVLIGTGSLDTAGPFAAFVSDTAPSTALTELLGTGAPISTVTYAGDIDGDGYGDAIVLANTFTGSTVQSVATLYRGGSDRLVGSRTFPALSGFVSTGWGVSTQSAAGGVDVNADGYADVVVSDAGNARALVFFGQPGGPGPAPSQVIASPATAGTEGAFAFGVANAGDMNGDGYSDVVISAPEEGTGELFGTGAVYLYLGGPSGLATQPALRWAISPPPPNMGPDTFGRYVATGSDVDGDGYSDVVIAGRVWTLAEFAGGATVATQPRNQLDLPNGDGVFHATLTTAADVDGDGLGDLVIAGPQSTGYLVGVYPGTPSGLSGLPSNVAVPSDVGPVNDAFGGCAAVDRDGSGYPDVLVGEPCSVPDPSCGQGRVLVFHASATGLAFNGVIAPPSDVRSGFGAVVE